MVVYTGDHVEGLGLVSNWSTFRGSDYKVDFSLQPLVTGLGSRLQAFHHLQLKYHIFLRLVLVCAAETLRKKFEARLLHGSQLLKGLNSHPFDLYEVKNVPLQILQHLKAEDSLPILRLGQ